MKPWLLKWNCANMVECLVWLVAESSSGLLGVKKVSIEGMKKLIPMNEARTPYYHMSMP